MVMHTLHSMYHGGSFSRHFIPKKIKPFIFKEIKFFFFVFLHLINKVFIIKTLRERIKTRKQCQKYLQSIVKVKIIYSCLKIVL